jgi:cytochrome c553
MKYIWPISSMLAITIFAVVWPLPGDAEPLAIRNCTWCHGASAEGYTPAPRLAGQKPAYIENQLVSFRARTRDAPFSKLYMWGAAANLSRQRMRDLATYFSALQPQAADDGDKKLAAMGQSIYQLGLPDSNIVACVACHGPNAEGVGQIPRLGGLAYPYLKRRLEQWQDGYQGAIPRPMPHIAGQLSGQQIAALASYLSFIEYPGVMWRETASTQGQ